MTASEGISGIHERGYCVLRGRLPRRLIEDCGKTFRPILRNYLEEHELAPNRGANRHYVPMPFAGACFAAEFFFDPEILEVVRGVMGARVVADQWGCDVALRGSEYQRFHADFQRPLFEETPDLSLPPYILAVSFGLADVEAEDGPIEIAVGTHRMARDAAIRSVEWAECEVETVLLEAGDVLIRHPWALHRGTPNRTDTPRAMATIRYVRRWYTDASREVEAIPRPLWRSLTQEQQEMIRFPLER